MGQLNFSDDFQILILNDSESAESIRWSILSNIEFEEHQLTNDSYSNQWFNAVKSAYHWKLSHADHINYSWQTSGKSYEFEKKEMKLE